MAVTETGPASKSTVTERPLREPAPTTPPAESQRFALEFARINEGFSREDARWAVDNLGGDWNENALEAIHELNQFTMNSRAGMLRDLTQGGFTQEEADWAVENMYPDAVG